MRLIYPICGIEKWIWKKFCPGKGDTPGLVEKDPAMYPYYVHLFFSGRHKILRTRSFVQSVQPDIQPPNSQCTVCTNLHKMRKNACNPCLSVVVYECQEEQNKKSLLILPLVRGKSPAWVNLMVSVSPVHLDNRIGNRPQIRKREKQRILAYQRERGSANLLFHVKH